MKHSFLLPKGLGIGCTGGFEEQQDSAVIKLLYRGGIFNGFGNKNSWKERRSKYMLVTDILNTNRKYDLVYTDPPGSRGRADIRKAAPIPAGEDWIIQAF